MPAQAGDSRQLLRRAMAMGRMRSLLQYLHGDTCGATAVEYAMIALFIAILLIAALMSIGSTVSGFFTEVANGF
jgi:Flp pilus assembly pilin Flp